jgi:hypothetical protein
MTLVVNAWECMGMMYLVVAQAETGPDMTTKLRSWVNPSAAVWSAEEDENVHQLGYHVLNLGRALIRSGDAPAGWQLFKG